MTTITAQPRICTTARDFDSGLPITSELTRPYHKNRVAGWRHAMTARDSRARPVQDEPRRATDLPEAVTIADAARLLGVSARTIQRFIVQGYLAPFYLPGSGRPRIPLDQINVIRRQTVPPPRSPRSTKRAGGRAGSRRRR